MPFLFIKSILQSLAEHECPQIVLILLYLIFIKMYYLNVLIKLYKYKPEKDKPHIYYSTT